ncbi:HesB/IscA family protein [Candidatus Bandiella euplotis]|uniref:Iron-sulfur cluster insertion protein ErpA n=1 Tax=Candidatus Bandiella euplotis TaxID=1664265 RepID=A0ABZ0ULV0_9RICK|nr:iron-sulfur cluster assembly accessory protein [Candidatus Bandiella woodruffii]WPX97119.1 Iron-sulfur cluster insertion protein ErpA [Candidatus Bandiella woodruffii]
MHKFIISENAANRINHLNSVKTAAKQLLRVKVDGGGCNGLRYQLDFVEDYADEDLVFTKKGAKVIVDKISITYLQNAELDYVEELGHSSFLINNPNSASKCGCGDSFSYKIDK